jgi:hypothetical protein
MPSYQTFSVKGNGDWDLQFVSEGQEAILQLLKIRLHTIKGSNKWNIEDGIDRRLLAIDSISISKLIQNIQDIITGTAGITEATVLNEKITFVNGTLKIPFQFKTIEQEEISEDVFVVNIS